MIQMAEKILYHVTKCIIFLRINALIAELNSISKKQNRSKSKKLWAL